MTKFLAHQHVRPYVYETLTTKELHFSCSEIQSRMDLQAPDALKLEYTRTMMGFLLFQPAPVSIAMIGLGGGSLAKFCHRHLPKTQLCVVEINPHVIAMRNEFRVPADSDRFRVLLGDGAEFVRTPPQHFDVLLVDGFDVNGLPRGLSSQRFYDDCADMLTPGGVLVVNLHCGHRQYVQQVERLRRSFNGQILLVDDSDQSNSIVFGKRDLALGGPPRGPLRRPRTLDSAAWASLQSSFAKIMSALKDDLT